MDLNSSEGYKDFDSILSKAVKHQKTFLLKKYVLFFDTVITILIGGYFAFNQMSSNSSLPDTPIDMSIIYPDSTQLSIQIDTILSATSDFTFKTLEDLEINNLPDENFKHNANRELENTIVFKVDTTSNLLEKVFVQASPVNGYAHLYEYLNLSIIYPDELVLDQENNKVIISFKITDKGAIDEVMIISSTHTSLDSIDIESIRNMPPWKPATINGYPTTTEHTIPLFFNLNN